MEVGSGRLYLIRESMGTPSYVVESPGNPVALNSSPHSARHLYPRTQAHETFTRDSCVRRWQADIEYRDTYAFINEIPQANKPTEQVMDDAVEFVGLRHSLRQLAKVKSDWLGPGGLRQAGSARAREAVSIAAMHR
ncbi:RtcB family protein [Brevibacterium permense]|uniref:RtcB family protein n=1 Tax=Brevibacterium permense TaxID=234834 RepID=UPI0021D032EC|nr:RtcB family protein [Brevibacterium permense]